MSGFGGAGAFSDGKYNITNDFGGTLYEYIGKEQALELMHYVDEINMLYGGEGTKLYSTAGTKFKKLCIQHKLNLLDASVRHLGTDINYVVLQNLYDDLKDKVEFHFDTPVHAVELAEGGYVIDCENAQLYLRASASSPSAAAAASGWRASATRSTSPPSPTASTSACASSCPPSSSPT